jgi:hypothetical protein
MKCHAGVEYPSGKPCPECGAKLGEVCWPGINQDLQDVKKLRDFAMWVDTWVSNPAASYSTAALDGLFGMTRDRIAALSDTSQLHDTQGK